MKKFTPDANDPDPNRNWFVDVAKDVTLSFRPPKPHEFGPQCGSDRNQPETCLHIVERGQNLWFILNGDLRADYERILNEGGGTKECLAFFRSKEATHRSSWSTIETGPHAAQLLARLFA